MNTDATTYGVRRRSRQACGDQEKPLRGTMGLWRGISALYYVLILPLLLVDGPEGFILFVGGGCGWKALLAVPRPATASPLAHWRGPDRWSTPSIHAVASFGAWIKAAAATGWAPSLAQGALTLVVAAVVASRLVLGEHSPRDVLVAAVVAAVSSVGWFVAPTPIILAVRLLLLAWGAVGVALYVADIPSFVLPTAEDGEDVGHFDVHGAFARHVQG